MTDRPTISLPSKLTIAQLRDELDELRALLAWGNDPCIYCGLASCDMARCEKGFPGCERSRDMGKLPLKRGWAKWSGKDRRGRSSDR